MTIGPRILLFCLLNPFTAGSAVAELWRSPLHDLTYVQVEKRLILPEYDPPLLPPGSETAQPEPVPVEVEPLPIDLAAALGPFQLDHPSFVAAYLSAKAVSELVPLLDASGLDYSVGRDRTINLPYHSFEAGGAERVAAGFPRIFAPVAIPGRFLVQFAYPSREEWLNNLETCGAKVVTTFPVWTLLVEAPSLEVLLGCPVSQYFSWIDAHLSTDRLSPEIAAGAGSDELSLEYPAGVPLEAKAQAVAPTVVVAPIVEAVEGEHGFLQVRATSEDLANIVATDRQLLALCNEGQAVWSDERQGMIVAGRSTGAGLLGPGYLAWLDGRGLLSPTNPQTVAVFDSGYDDGSLPSPPERKDHHPDMETPERLLALENFATSAGLKDPLGHGTMVAGILAGKPAPVSEPGGSLRDAQNYAYGLGIAPNSMLFFGRLDLTAFKQIDPDRGHDRALRRATTPIGSAPRAFIVNQSWNQALSPIRQDLPLPTYDRIAQWIDARAIDANTGATPKEPILFVFSAGNLAYQPQTNPANPLQFNTVASPATAKNVLAVGATESYRPEPEPPLGCRPISPRPPNQDATHTARLGLFSGRGQRYTTGQNLHSVRIKPDLVAPGVRVFSIAPYGNEALNFYFDSTSVGCARYYPEQSTGYFYTYGTGTSFAAPAVSGVAAHARKWFLDRQTTSDPSPSLIKAALIATAEDLGGQVGNEHRPSAHSGWGRVSLNRLTDPAVSRFWYDLPAGALTTNGFRTFTVTVGDPTKDLLVTLAWSDPPSDCGSSQTPLVNDLQLDMKEIGTANAWRGNNFQKNRGGGDTGFSYRYTAAGQARLSDKINNVESIFIPASQLRAGQRFQITVTGASVPFGSQRFALYAYNAR